MTNEKRFMEKRASRVGVVKTIEKYKFQFKPLRIKGDDPEVVVAVEVSGTFDGSPVTLDYHFTVENEKILSLTID
jgi:ABC-type transporter MlaC component